MSNNKFTEYNLPTDAYAAFDATSLKRLIIDRLTDNKVLTDQIYEGSNVSSIIDIVAYSYHVLIYYLNRTANESMFSQSEIYENMNRIVKLVNYKPLGDQTSILPFSLTTTPALTRGIYTIPRYSFINAGGIDYSFTKDITFSKQTDSEEPIQTVSEETMLYQGKYVEYPKQRATGEPFETVVITIDDRVIIDHENINVYVYDDRLKIYSEFIETSSLFLAQPDEKLYEKRYNENKRYEIKFGNNINGAQLNAGDVIHIVYLKSDGAAGKVGANTLANQQLTIYTSTVFAKIRKGIQPENVNYITFDDVVNLKFNNETASTSYAPPEEPDNIRRFAPEFFKSQNRLVTATDYHGFVTRTYGNIINDVKAVSNSEYVNNHLKYYDETLGMTSPTLESRVLYNQVKFADANNTNNIHMYVVPKVVKKTSGIVQTNFLAPAQKELIRNGVSEFKMLTDEVVFQDPVYMAVGFGISLPSEAVTSSIKDTTRLVLERSPTAKKNAFEIQQLAGDIILDYFSHETSTLGQTINLSDITSKLNSLDGIQKIYMTRSDAPTYTTTGLSLLVWNPIFSDRDITIVNQNLTLPFYKYPYLFDAASLIDSIDVTQALR
jgi:hypothetical protein